MKKAQVLRKLKHHAPTVLTCIGAVGVVGTSVLTAKATVKATRILDEAAEVKGEALTEMEVVKLAGPAYIPAVMLGVGTITCIFGANILNKRTQASLISAYAMLDSSYKEYKKKVNDLYGENANKEVQASIAQDKYEEADKDEDLPLFYDIFSGRYFNAKMEDVIMAEYEINRIASTEGGIELNKFYDMVGLEPLEAYDELGWSAAQVYDMCWHPWIEFTHEKTELDDGMEVHYIEMLPEPTPDFLDY